MRERESVREVSLHIMADTCNIEEEESEVKD